MVLTIIRQMIHIMLLKLLPSSTAPDSIQYRQIQVYAEDAAKTATLADSIFNALKDGADFADIAKKYGQSR